MKPPANPPSDEYSFSGAALRDDPFEMQRLAAKDEDERLERQGKLVAARRLRQLEALLDAASRWCANRVPLLSREGLDRYDADEFDLQAAVRALEEP